MPDLKKVELLDGVVFMPPPVSVTQHGFQHSDLMYWLAAYCVATPGVRARITARFEVPDELSHNPTPCSLHCRSMARNISFDESGCLMGIPDFAAEIAFSSVNYDLHTKLALYERLGIPEYLVWRTSDKAIDWFAFQTGRISA